MNAFARLCLLPAALLLLTGCPDPKPPAQSPTVVTGDDTVYGENRSSDSAFGDEEVIDETPNYNYTEDSVESSNLDIPDDDRAIPANLDWEPVYFEFDQSRLTAGAKDVLRGYAEILKNNANLIVLLEGHCDSRGTEDYNLALGERRAQTVKRYLLELGVPASQMRTISYGELRPSATGENEEAWAKNRRVAFRF